MGHIPNSSEVPDTFLCIFFFLLCPCPTLRVFLPVKGARNFTRSSIGRPYTDDPSRMPVTLPATRVDFPYTESRQWCP